MNLLEFIDSELQKIAQNNKCKLSVRFHAPTNSMVILFSEVDLMLEFETMSFLQDYFNNPCNKALLVSAPKVSQQHTQLAYELNPNLIDVWSSPDYK